MAINDMLKDFYFNDGYENTLKYFLHENIEADEYYKLRRKFKEEYRPKLLKRFSDPFIKSIILNPNFYRVILGSAASGVEAALKINDILNAICDSGTNDTLAANLFVDFVSVLLLITTNKAEIVSIKDLLDRIMDKFNNYYY